MVVTYISGQVPNLPWWRIRDMTDQEIRLYNDRFLTKETRE